MISSQRNFGSLGLFGIMNSDYLRSEIYLAKGEQAFYQPIDIGGGLPYMDEYSDCSSVDDNKSHSCSWLEIRKTGDPIA